LRPLTRECHAQDRDKNLLSQLQKLRTEKKDIEEDIRQMVLIMEDRRAELTKQREAYDQVLYPRVMSPTPVDGQSWISLDVDVCGIVCL
jgi:hypothetical protein